MSYPRLATGCGRRGRSQAARGWCSLRRGAARSLRRRSRSWSGTSGSVRCRTGSARVPLALRRLGVGVLGPWIRRSERRLSHPDSQPRGGESGSGHRRGSRHDHSSAPCALLTTVTKATLAGKVARAGWPVYARPAYPVCPHWALARGCCAPLRTPGLSRRCRSTGRTGAPPGAPPPDPRPGALLTERRTVVVPARIVRADQAAFGPAGGPPAPQRRRGGHRGRKRPR